MKITHPVKGYSGQVRVGDRGFHFLAGVASARNVRGKVREALEAGGFTVETDADATDTPAPPSTDDVQTDEPADENTVE